jgi:hypothetical protein
VRVDKRIFIFNGLCAPHGVRSVFVDGGWRLNPIGVAGAVAEFNVRKYL